MSFDFDPFQPRHEPARTLYDAFQTEARLRKTRELNEWLRLEPLAVLEAARVYAAGNGLRAPLLDEVLAAERYARGSVDYGSKWAIQVARLMTPKVPDPG